MIETILDKVKKRVDSAEVCFIETEAREVSFESGTLKNVEQRSILGISLRVIRNGHLGFSSTTDMNRIDDTVESAIASSQFGKTVKFEFPNYEHKKTVETFDSAIASYQPINAVDEGKRAVELLGQLYPKGLTDVIISCAITTVHIANTSGFSKSYAHTNFRHSIVMTVIDGDSIVWIGDGGEYGTLTIRTNEYVTKISDLARKSEKKAVKVNGTLPVIFTAEEMPNLVGSLNLGINGLRLVKGDSPLIGKEGECVLGNVTITDDPLINGAPESRPFDDEGIPSRRTVIFQDGVFQTFLFDLETAGDAGRISTGSASRGHLSSPSIDTSNIVMSTGESSLEEMIAGMSKGIIIYGVLGGGQLNLIAGDFAFNCMFGFLIENGEYAGRLIDTMVSGNVYQAFGAIRAMGRESRQVGSHIVPDIMFDNISVSSR